MADVNLTEWVARALAGLAPGEDWPTNEALGGSPTGTRDDEYHAAMLDQARDALTVLRSPAVVAGIAGVLGEHGGFVQAEDNTEVRCSCGHLLWLIGVGFTAGPVSGAVLTDTAAHRHHQARAVMDWLTGGAR